MGFVVQKANRRIKRILIGHTAPLDYQIWRQTPRHLSSLLVPFFLAGFLDPSWSPDCEKRRNRSKENAKRDLQRQTHKTNLYGMWAGRIAPALQSICSLSYIRLAARRANGVLKRDGAAPHRCFFPAPNWKWYYGVAMAETLKCPACGTENEVNAKECSKCPAFLKSDLECLRSIDRSLGTIKGIAIWWLILSILSVIAAFFYAATRSR